jgi:hypothetical protein
LKNAFFIIIGLIVALLVAGITECAAARYAIADMNFGHEPAEVFGVVGQMVEVGGVQIKHAAGRI